MDTDGTKCGRMLRDAGSWYEHSYVFDGYTNYGEVLEVQLAGSNSLFFFKSN